MAFHVICKLGFSTGIYLWRNRMALFKKADQIQVGTAPHLCFGYMALGRFFMVRDHTNEPTSIIVRPTDWFVHFIGIPFEKPKLLFYGCFEKVYRFFVSKFHKIHMIKTDLWVGFAITVAIW